MSLNKKKKQKLLPKAKKKKKKKVITSKLPVPTPLKSNGAFQRYFSLQETVTVNKQYYCSLHPMLYRSMYSPFAWSS